MKKKIFTTLRLINDCNIVTQVFTTCVNQITCISHSNVIAICVYVIKKIKWPTVMNFSQQDWQRSK